jgi:hypothetical protein
MTTAEQIIDALGGISSVAKELELTPSTVSSWKIKKRIPRWWMQPLTALAERKGIDLNALSESEAA